MKKVSVSGAVCLRECPLAESWLFYYHEYNDLIIPNPIPEIYPRKNVSCDFCLFLPQKQDPLKSPPFANFLT